MSLLPRPLRLLSRLASSLYLRAMVLASRALDVIPSSPHDDDATDS